MLWKILVGAALAGLVLWLFTGRPPTLADLDEPPCRSEGGGSGDHSDEASESGSVGGWCYRVAGSGDEHLLVLLGGLGTPAEIPTALRPLSSRMRVWAVTHPPLRSVDEVAEGLVAFMDARGIPTAHVFGASAAGAAVQQLTRVAPGRVASMILSNSAAPLGRDLPAGLWTVLRRPMARIPPGLLGAWARDRLAAVVEGETGGEASQVTEGLTAAHLFGLGDLIVDFHRQRFTTADLEGWPGRILILESEDDPMVPEKYRRRLRELYPGARVHTFSTGGHTPSLRHPVEFRGAVRSFLEGSP